jgi:hypothetical protein
MFLYKFRDSCPSPHRALCYCCLDSHSPNQLDEELGRGAGREDNAKLRAEYRAKDWLDRGINILRLWGLIIGGLAWVWVEEVDGDEGMGLEA